MNKAESVANDSNTRVSTAVGDLQQEKSLFLSFYKHKNLALAGVFVFLFAGFFAVISMQASTAQAAACNATGTGTWGGASDTASFTSCTGAAANGSGTGNRPAAADTLTVNAGIALTLAGNVQVAGFTIAAQAASNAPITMTGFTLTNTGTFVCTLPSANTVTTTITIGTGTLANTGLITLNGGATSRVCAMTLSTGVLTMGGGITFTGATPTFTNSAAATINLNGGTFAALTGATINAGTALNVAGSPTLTIAKTWGALTVSSGTLTVSGASTFASANITGNLLIGAVATTVSGTTTINSGGTVKASSATGTKTFTGDVTVNSSGTFDLSNGGTVAAVSAFSGNLTNNSVNNFRTSTTGLATLNGTKTLSGTGSFQFGGLTLAALAVISLNANATVNNNLTLNAAVATNTSLTHGSAVNLSVTGTVTLTEPTGAGQTLWNINAGTATVTGATTIGSNTNTAARVSKIVLTTGTASFGALNFKSGTTDVQVANAVLDLSGGAATVNISGAITRANLGTITPGTTSTVTFNGTAAQTIPMGTASNTFWGACTTQCYANLTVTNTFSTGATLGNTTTAANLAGNLTIGNGSAAAIFNNGGFAITGNAAKTFQVTNAATFNMTGTATTLYPTGFTTFTYGATSTVNYKQNVAALTIANPSGGYGHLGLLPAGANALILPSGTITIAGNLTIGNGTNAGATATANDPTITVSGNVSISNNATFVASDGNMNVGGNWTLGATAPVFTPGTGTVTFTATTTKTISGPVATAIVFYNLTFNGSGGDWSISTSGEDLNVQNALTINAGTFRGGNSNNYIRGGATGGGVLDTTGVGGGWVFDCFLSNSVNWTLTAGFQTSNLGGVGCANANTLNASGAGNIIAGSVVTIGSGTIFNAGSKTYTISRVVSPLITTGATFNYETSTFNFTGDGASDIPAITYYNLGIKPGGASAPVLTTGTYTVMNDFTVGDGTNAGVNAETNDPTINITRDFIISAGATYTASSTNAITIGRNFTNGGTFTAGTGTVILNTTTQADVTGSTSFYSLTISVATGKTVRFGTGNTFTIGTGGAGVLTLTGSISGQIVLTSTNTSNPPTTNWTINHQGTESITYTTINYGTCHASSTQITANGTGDVQGTGNSGSCWVWPVTGISIAGTLYSSQGSGALASKTVAVKVNGAGSVTTTTAGDGTFTLSSVVTNSGDVLTLYVSGATENANTVTISSGSNLTSIDLYQNRVIVRYETGSSITNTNLDQFDDGNNSNNGDVMFTVTTGALTLNDGAKLLVWTGKTFAPGGTVTTNANNNSTTVDGDIEIGSGSTLNMASNALSIGGDFVSAGTFSESASPHTTTFTSTVTGNTIDLGTGNFENVTFNGAAGGWSFSDASNTISGDLTITAGTLSGTTDLTVSGGDVTGAGTLNLTGGTLTVDGAGTFGGTPDWTTYNLSFTGSGTTTTGTGAGAVNVSTVLTIGTSHTFNAGSKTYVLAGGSTPFVATGVFTAATSTIRYTNHVAVNVTSSSNGGTTITYYVLEVKPTTTCVGNPTIGTASGHTITSYTFDIGTAAGSCSITSATYNPAINVSGVMVINSGNTYLSGSGNLTFSSSDIPLQSSGTFTASTGNTVIYTSGSGVNSLADFAPTYYNLTINGTGTFYSASTGFTVTNNTTLTSGTLALYSGETAIFNGNVTGNGVYDATGGFTTVNGGAGKNIGGDADWAFITLTLTGVVTATGTGSFTIQGSLSNSGTLNAGSKTWTFSNGGSPFSPTGTFNANTSTVIFNGSSDQNIPALTYYHLIFSPTTATQTYTLGAGTITVSNTFETVYSGSTMLTINADTNDPILDFNGAFQLDTNTTFIASATAAMTVAGTFSNEFGGTFTHSNGTVTLDGASTFNVSNTSPFFNLSMNNASGTWTATGNLTIAGSLLIYSGNFNASSRTITLSGSGTPFQNSGTFTYGTSTVNYTTTSSVNIAPLNGSGTTNAYYNLGLGTTSDSSSASYSLLSDATVNNVVTVSNAGSTGTDSFGLGSSILTLKGTGTPLNIISGKGALSAATSSVQYTSGSGVTALSSIAMTGTNTFYNLTINGTGTFNATTAIEAFSLTVTSGTLTGSQNFSTTGGDVSGDGVINMTGGAFTFDGNISFGGNTAWAFNNLNFGTSNKDYAYTAVGSGAINVTGILTITDMLSAGSKTWNLSGSGTPFVIASGILSPDTSTFNYTGTSSTTITDSDYYNLGVKPGANSVTHTFASGNFLVNNNLVIGDGTHTSDTVTAVGVTSLSVVGTGTSVDIKVGTTFAAPSNISSFTVSGSWSNTGSFTHNSGTVTFTAVSAGKTITSGGGQFYNVVFSGSGGGWSPSDAMVIANDLTMTTGTLSGTNNVTVNGGDVTGNATINMTGGTFLVDATGNFGGTTAWTFNNLTFGDGTGATTTTATGAGGVTVTGVLAVAANQTLNAGSKSWTLSGAGTPITRSGTFTAGTSTFNYTSATGVTALSSAAMTGASAFYDLAVNQSGQTFTAGVAAEAANSLTVTAGTLAMGTNNLTVGNSANTNSGSIKVASGQSLTQSAAGLTTVLGSAAGSNCIGSGGALCIGVPGTFTFGSLTIGNASTTFTTTFAGTAPTITIGTLLTVTTNATLNAGSATSINLTGNGTVFTKNGTFTPGTSTVNYNSAATTGTTVPSISYYNVVLNKASNTFTASSGTLAATNNLTITAGNLDLNTNDPTTTISGNLIITDTLSASSASGLTLNGNFTNNGTFTDNGGTVIMAPTAVVSNFKITNINGSSNTTFYNLTNTTGASKLIFKSGNTYTISNNLTITGVSGSPIWLKSDVDGVYWTISMGGTATLAYVLVQDSNCSGGNSVVGGETIFNQGHNGACWGFIIRGGGGASGGDGGAGAGGNSGGNGGAGGNGSNSQATATVSVQGGGLNTFTVTNGGSGYIVAPLVCMVGGGGANGAATAIVSGGAVTSIGVDVAGTGYVSPPTVVIGAPGTSGGACGNSGGGNGGSSGGGGGASP